MERESAEGLATILKYQKYWRVWIFEDSATGVWISAEDLRIAISYIPKNTDVPEEIMAIFSTIDTAMTRYVDNGHTEVIILPIAEVPVLWLVAQALIANLKAILVEHKKSQEKQPPLLLGGTEDLDQLQEVSNNQDRARLEFSITKFNEFIQAVIAGSSDVVFRRQLFLPHQHDEFIDFYVKEF